MTAHTHTSVVEGCYRCELNKDEAEAATEGYIWGADGPDGQRERTTYVFAESDRVVPGHVLVTAQDEQDCGGVYVTPEAARQLATLLLEVADEVSQ